MRPSEGKTPSETAELTTLARQFSATLAASIVSAALGFVLILIATRGLGAQRAGVFFVILGVFSVARTVLTLGADLGVMRMISRHLALGEPGSVRTIIVAGSLPVAVLSVAAVLALLALAPEVGPRLARGAAEAEPAALLRTVMAFLPVATVSAVIVAATRGFGTMTPYIVADQLAVPLLSAIGVGIVVMIDPAAMSLLGVAWALPTLAGLAYAVFALACLVKRLPRTGRLGPSPSALWRSFWSFASVRAAAAVAQVLVRWLDVILVGALASARHAGIYAAVSRLVLVGTLPQRAIIRVLAPRFSALLTVDDRARAQTLYRTSTIWLIGLSFPFYLLIAAFASIAVLIFGPEFEAGATALAILSIATLVNIATGPVTTILLMAGKATWNLANSYGSLVINVALNVVLIPTFGITGAAVAWAASVVFQNLVPTWQIFRTFGLHPLGPGALAVGGAALVIYGLGGGAVQAVITISPAITVVTAIALTAIYVATLWRFRHLLAIDYLRESVRPRPRKSIAAQNG